MLPNALSKIGNSSSVSNGALTSNLKAIAQKCIDDYDFAQRLFSNPANALKETDITLNEDEMNTLNIYLILFSNKTSSVLYASSGLFDFIFAPPPPSDEPDERGGGPWWLRPIT